MNTTSDLSTLIDILRYEDIRCLNKARVWMISDYPAYAIIDTMSCRYVDNENKPKLDYEKRLRSTHNSN